VSGSDDAATREYRYGDDLRKVHWRSTARVGELMVRREEQPFQSRATLLLDCRGQAHRGDGPGSSFEWAVSAMASISVSLARTGFGVRMLADSGLDLVPAGVPVTEGSLLDTLAGVGASQAESISAATEHLRRSGIDGVLVAVLGSLTPEDAQALSRLRHGSAACIAVLMDTDTWAPTGPRQRSVAAAAFEQSTALLATTGWRVLQITHGTTLASVWPLAGNRTGRTEVSA
jgi:uncharacterized protein (DUF58 family)